MLFSKTTSKKIAVTWLLIVVRILIKHLRKGSFPAKLRLQFYKKDNNRLQDCLGTLFLKRLYFVLLHWLCFYFVIRMQIWTFFIFRVQKLVYVAYVRTPDFGHSFVARYSNFFHRIFKVFKMFLVLIILHCSKNYCYIFDLCLFGIQRNILYC